MKVTLLVLFVVAIVGMTLAYPEESPEIKPREGLAEGVAPQDLAKEGFSHFGYGGYHGGYYRPYYSGYHGGYHRRPYYNNYYYW